jgi:primosomal protein N' (replication factor Y)
VSDVARHCEVAVALPVAQRYTYRVPPPLASAIVVGARVTVPFAGRKVAGVVIAAPVAPPAEAIELADVAAISGTPVPPELVALALWVADYYEAPPGEALRLVVPAGTAVASAAVIRPTERGRAALAGEGAALPSRQRRLLARVGVADAPVARAELTRWRAELDALAAAGLVEELDARTRPIARLARERVASLPAGLDIEAARATLARAPKRRAVLAALAAAGAPVPVTALTAAIAGAAAALRELVAAGLAIVDEREQALVARGGSALPASAAPPALTAEQEVAVEAITGAIGGFASFLLHGVTGSGKTEVYLRVIALARARGLGAIVLVPEIALTPQLAARFRARFGDEVAILHSGLSESDRLSEWERLHRGQAAIAVGARSAVFAPVARPGVIVVDEEHDGSFKQDEGVRYHGRDVALVRAQRAGAVCVLGSATPSLESFAAAQAGRLRLLTMNARATGALLPTVEVIDLRRYQPDGEDLMSAPLAAALERTLAAGEQAILFLNRRGFATFVLCRACGHAFRCRDCAVSLTYHRASDRLECHYCGFGQRVPDVCPSCKAAGAIERKGLGTERVAAGLAARFPSARVARLDRDVATGARAEGILARVARREVDILVGTQMVTKGHDFPGVTLVGVLCADLALSLPDFRAAERTFQLLTQVAGRAGRGERPGHVVIQSYRPEAEAVDCAARHDYARFAEVEQAARADLGYPPAGRLCAVRIEGPDEPAVVAAAQQLGALAVALARRDDDAVLVRGPVAAPLARLRGRARWQIWLRAAERAPLRRVVRGLLAADVKGARVVADVDPLSTL